MRGFPLLIGFIVLGNSPPPCPAELSDKETFFSSPQPQSQVRSESAVFSIGERSLQDPSTPHPEFFTFNDNDAVIVEERPNGYGSLLLAEAPKQSSHTDGIVATPLCQSGRTLLPAHSRLSLTITMPTSNDDEVQPGPAKENRSPKCAQPKPAARGHKQVVFYEGEEEDEEEEEEEEDKIEDEGEEDEEEGEEEDNENIGPSPLPARRKKTKAGSHV
ncbi:hypothetical protein PM082_020049 [Marasmius tenuissimus]|nr:hypothetical protein PM082_020049 [Marasmius tenuissimus]